MTKTSKPKTKGIQISNEGLATLIGELKRQAYDDISAARSFRNAHIIRDNL